ncbi:ADOP family duplicated permease [Paludibaculum fermentans]|uniref:ABC transporter permease n=1 Tax=Paludibaculum fermentans TaxID=1473598 RepID=UPI003EBB1134
MRDALRRLGWLLSRRKRDAELADELAFHLEEEARARRAEGLTAREAQLAARRELGNPLRVAGDTRASWGWQWVDYIVQDARYALRNLRRAPAFTTAAILSLALGIGAPTGIFSLLNAVVLRPLPVPAPNEMVQLAYTLPLWETNPGNWNSWFDYPQFERLRKESRTMSGIFGGTRVGRVNLESGGTSGLAQLDAYSGNFFAVLGVRPALGRLFSEEEDTLDASVVVLSDQYWRTRFAADPSIVGRAVTINRVPFTVAGVTPPEFRGIAIGNAPDAWVPLRSTDRLAPGRKERWTEPFASWLLLAGRVRTGIDVRRAEAELDLVHRRVLQEQLALSPMGREESTQRFVQASHLMLRPAASGMHSGLRETYSLPLKVLMCIAGLVLLASCANLANLLLARASSRRREIEVRQALGAGRRRIVQQLLTESSVLTLMGGVLAMAIAWGSSALLLRVISTGDTPLSIDLSPDANVLAFSLLTTFVAAGLFGLAPALRASRGSGSAMRTGSRQVGPGSRALDRGLIVAQVALSVALVAGAGLFVRTFQNLWGIDPGFNRDDVLMFSVDAKLAGYGSDKEQAAALYSEILRRMQAMPGVRSAGASIVRPVDDQFYLIDRVNEIDGRALAQRDTIKVAWNAVSHGYFDTVATRILLGRDIQPGDDGAAPKVVVVNQSFANRAFANGNPIGHRVGLATIVGVVKDSLYNGMRDQPRPVLYYSIFQHGREQGFRWGFVSYELRYANGMNLGAQVRRELEAVDRSLPLFRLRTLKLQLAQSLLKEQLLAMLSAVFGGVALLLACIGLYGLISYNVARRIPEIGIRTALGAPRRHLFWLIQREALVLTLAGVALGIPMAMLGARYARTLLFEVAPSDPVTLVTAAVLLLGVAVVAGYAPLRRVLRVDPASALRCE